MNNYKKVLIGFTTLVVLTLAFFAGYYFMPEKIVTKVETKTITETKYVSVIDKKQVESLTLDIAKLKAEKIAIELQLAELNSKNSEAVLKLKAFRTAEVSGWVANLEAKIVAFKDLIKPIDLDIKWYQDQIVLKQSSINLLQAQVNSKQLLIQALVANNPIGNLAQIRLLEDEIIVIRADISVLENIIKGFNDNIALKNADKLVIQNKIVLDEKCISEIGRYINDATAFSSEVNARLKVLGLI